MSNAATQHCLQRTAGGFALARWDSAPKNGGRFFSFSLQNPPLAEETWFRLFLMGLCSFFLRPAFRSRPAVAVVATVLFSGITFGMGHGFTLERFLVTGLLYGVPLAAIFARHDWEYAFGAHDMVNMFPWLMVFLET